MKHAAGQDLAATTLPARNLCALVQRRNTAEVREQVTGDSRLPRRRNWGRSALCDAVINWMAMALPPDHIQDDDQEWLEEASTIADQRWQIVRTQIASESIS